MSKIMAVDYGSKRVGVALADSTLKIGVPYGCIQLDETRTPIAEISAIVSTEQVERIVVGKPIMMDGTDGAMVARVENFADELQSVAKVPVVLWDERLSSNQAERLFRGEARGRAGKRRKRGDIDAMAATIILESYIAAQ